MGEIEKWNDPKKDIKGIMMRSESGRRLLELEKRSFEQDFMNRIERKEDKNERKEPSKRSSFKYTPQSFCAILADLTRCDGFSDPNTRFISNDAEQILVRSGVPTSAAGFFLPLSDETRAITAQNAPLGTFIASFNRALNDHLILSKLGITQLPNLVGASRVCEYSGSTAKWAGDTDSAQNGKGTFNKVELTPHRLTAYLNVSRLELAQNIGIASFLADDLAQGVAEAIEYAVFGDEAHSDNKPDGFFTGKDITPMEATYTNILSIEGAVRNNGMPMNWAMNGDCERRLKTTQRNGSSIVTGGLCSDRPYFVSDMIPRITTGEGSAEKTGDGIIYGRWSDFILASWGALEIIYNPYTQAINGQATFIVNFYTDWTWVEKSFKTAAVKSV
ncbi:phage major capsid protein [Parabacteroides distasonis]|uniref:phage major capsid protein n=1 Tax=Parabacteroides distasonis TaxID=823 RepID=UPI0039B54C41